MSRFALIFNALVLLLIALVALSPLISVAIAGEIASSHGCQLDEGSIHPCMVNGQDMGETLYSMGVMGWFMLVTIPIGGLVFIVYLLGVVIFYVIKRSRQIANAQPGGNAGAGA